jgi:sensor histidine kinase YesM
MEKINDKWVRLGGIGLLSINSVVNSPTLYAKNGMVILQRIVISVLVVILIWEGSRLIILQMRKRFSAESGNRNRLFVTTGICTVYNSIILISLIYFTEYSKATDGGKLHIIIISSIISSLVLSGFFMGVYEAIYYFNRLGKAEQEKKELTRINLQGQFDSLKGQVNPHFLFNSLNSLRQLVLKDPEKAARYVEEMSDVYRYLLRNNDGELTTLKNELDFIHSYCHLLKTRFGEGLQVSMNVTEEWMQYSVPPLTLQMLFENCVKHNIISTQQPLRIKVYTEGSGKLVVSNNLQKKMQSIQSEKIGLANIITKYKYLGCPDVSITESAHEFIVSLPLIKKQVHEHSDY